MGFGKDNNLESVSTETKMKTQKIDRVVLDSDSIAAIHNLQQQANHQLGDLVQISQKDIVNFILQERTFSLTEEELNKLKSAHFDLVKALKKATLEVIKAKQSGSEIQLDEVLKMIQTPGVIQSPPSKKARGRKSKVESRGDTQNENDASKDSSNAVSSAKSNATKDSNSDSKIEEIQNFSDKKSP